MCIGCTSPDRDEARAPRTTRGVRQLRAPRSRALTDLVVVAELVDSAPRHDNDHMSHTAHDELLTVPEVAERLRVSTETVRRKLVVGRELRGVRVGRMWRVFASSVRALLGIDSDTMSLADPLYRGAR